MSNRAKFASIPKTITTTTTFLPTSIAGCALWLDGADPTTLVFSSGSNISQWNDKSGNAKNITQPTQANQPSYTAASNSVLFSDTTFLLMGNTTYFNTLFASPFTMFFVHKKLQSYAWLVSPGNYVVTFPGTLRVTTAAITDLDYTTPTFSSAATEPMRMFTVQLTGAERNVRMNGQLTAYNTNNNGSTSWTTAPVVDANWRMGGNWNNLSTAGQTQNMYEVIFYNTALGTTQRQTVESYLAQKWGLTSSLPVSHPGLTTLVYGTTTVNAPTTTTTTTTFLPTSIAGCQLWFDASDTTTLTLSGSTITQWRDKVINLQLSVGSGTNTLTQNAFGNMQAISFNGGYLVSPSSVFTATENVNNINQFVIMKRTANTAYGLVAGIGFYTQNTKNSIYINGNQAQIIVRRGYTTNGARYDGPLYDNTINQGYIYSALTDYQASTYQLIINGSTNAATTFGGTGTTTGDTSLIYVGSTSFNEPFYGYVAEYIIYNTALSATNRQTIESYLAQKWGMTASLPVGHPGLTTPVYTQTITVALPRQKIRTIPRAAAVVNFLPTSIAGCVMWLDAADLTSMTLNGANVSQWTDKSGSGNSVTQASSGSQPTTGGTLNGLNTLYFTGKTMTYTGISVSAQTVFCIYLNNTFTPYGEPVEIGPFAFFYAAPSSNVGIGRTAATDEVLANWSTNGLTTSKYTIYGGTVSVSGSTTSVLYFNGNQVASTTVSSSGGVTHYNIGHYGGATTGYLAEVLIYNSVLNQTNRQNVESYLAQKWALTSNLPVGHPGLTTTVYGTAAPVPTVRQKIRIIQPAAPLISYTQTFAYTGSNQTFTVPATTTSLTVYIWGAGGGGNTNYGGAGAMVQGVLLVTPGETLTIVVGQGGTIDGTTTFGGGGAGGGNMTGGSAAGIGNSGNGFPQNAGSGGGRSAIQRGGTDPTNDIVVAGGGGGGTFFSSDRGGSATFSGTANAGVGGLPGLGGTQSAGGAGGGTGQYGQGLSGSRGIGGNTYNTNVYNGGGGGGGGYYGGGGGGTNGGDGAGGGGGSSLTSTLSLISGQSVLGFNSTNGYTAPNNTSPYYASSVGNGAPAINSNPRAGGNGLIVLVYMA